ncbi:hypothetical protein BFP72_12905 [Reichenbachiella sp. 5M10]|nr:hypothetical protein BFP72_12905 [Reichenbachiella sp. 5M10]
MIKRTLVLSLSLVLLWACETKEDSSIEDNQQEDASNTAEKNEAENTEQQEESDLSQTPLEAHGQLQVKGNELVDENGKVAQLRGMSFFWSQWQAAMYNETIVDYLAQDWKVDIIRAAMAVEHEGYKTHPETEIKKVDILVQAAVKNGLYVIIDYHSHEASKDPDTAADFFGQMAKKYKDIPNVIYEIYNEPLEDDWVNTLVPYATQVIAAIRAHDPDNLILCGTRTWSQRVDEVVQQPLTDPNIAYVLHFYAGTHKQWLRDTADKARAAGLCIFVSEFGVINANGDGAINYESTKKWMEWMDDNQLSWCNWAVSEKAEGASIFKPGTPGDQTPTTADLTESGLYLRSILLDRNYDKP